MNKGGIHNPWIKLLICYFLGVFGVHKFIEKKKGLGILYLCTFGLFGIGWLVDIIKYLITAIQNITGSHLSAEMCEEEKLALIRRHLDCIDINQDVANKSSDPHAVKMAIEELLKSIDFLLSLDEILLNRAGATKTKLPAARDVITQNYDVIIEQAKDNEPYTPQVAIAPECTFICTDNVSPVTTINKKQKRQCILTGIFAVFALIFLLSGQFFPFLFATLFVAVIIPYNPWQNIIKRKFKGKLKPIFATILALLCLITLSPAEAPEPNSEVLNGKTTATFRNLSFEVPQEWKLESETESSVDIEAKKVSKLGPMFIAVLYEDMSPYESLNYVSLQNLIKETALSGVSDKWTNVIVSHEDYYFENDLYYFLINGEWSDQESGYHVFAFSQDHSLYVYFVPFTENDPCDYSQDAWNLVSSIVGPIIEPSESPSANCAPQNTTESTTESAVATTETITELVTEPPTEPSSEPTVAPEDSIFSIHFIDVGQADAALVECDGHYMLIDGGNKADSNVIFSVLKKANVPKLDIVVGTHGHEDHIGGLPGAFNYCNAELTLCPVTSYDSEAFEDFAKYAEQEGNGITVPSAGDTYSLGSAKVEILGLNGGSDANDTSIILRIVYGNTSFLFTGDAEREAEQAVLRFGADLSATVLKVGHHGSDSSTTYPFLREIMPLYAVVSVGEDNSYGHPTEDTLSRLRDADVKVFRTDMQGDIFCESDGETVTMTVTRNADADVLSGPMATEPPTEPPTEAPTEPPTEAPVVEEVEGTDYVGNKNTKKFHYDWCSSVDKMKESNKYYYTGTRDDMLAKGYVPCKNCDP